MTLREGFSGSEEGRNADNLHVKEAVYSQPYMERL